MFMLLSYNLKLTLIVKCTVHFLHEATTAVSIGIETFINDSLMS